MESDDVRFVLELSSYKSDLQWNPMENFKLGQQMELF